MAKKIALLIGNSQYDDDRLSILSAPWADVVDLEKVLQEVGGFDTVPLFNAGLIEARRAIGSMFKDRSPDDLVLLYYTGHGVRDDYGDLFFALPHTDIGDLRATSLGAHFIRTEMDRSTSRRQILILDCCHSGAFMRGGAKRAEGPANLTRADFVDPVGHGRFVLAASSANESAFERDGRSLFTRHLVDGLANGAAAPEKDKITIRDLHTYLCRGVSAEKAPMQPRLWVDEQTDELVIARNPHPRKPIAPELIKLLGDADAYRALGAATQLIDIYCGTDSQQAADAEKALRQRLASPEDLPVLVADPIRAALFPTAAPEPAVEVKALQQRLEEEETKRGEVEATLEAERETHRKEVDRLETLSREQGATIDLPTDVRVRRNWTPFVLGLILGGSVSLVTFVSVLSDIQELEDQLAEAQQAPAASQDTDQRLDELRRENRELAVKAGDAEAAIEWLREALARQPAARDEPSLSRDEIHEMQSLLNEQGFNVMADGVSGPATVAAANRFRASLDLAGLEQPDRDTLALLRLMSMIRESAGAMDGPIKDCPECPEMVRIPAGTFWMGSPDGEADRNDDEGPQREVAIGAFALARTEVTFDQWQACVDDGGCRSNPEPRDGGWGRGTRPVINVSWHDAQEYVRWLNTKVAGDPYRLPSEAEWEYAARSREPAAYPWGNKWDPSKANGAQDVDKTTPVGAYPANAFGLHDMIGNVSEWCEDVYESDYSRKPDDGSAHLLQPIPSGGPRWFLARQSTEPPLRRPRQGRARAPELLSRVPSREDALYPLRLYPFTSCADWGAMPPANLDFCSCLVRREGKNGRRQRAQHRASAGTYAAVSAVAGPDRREVSAQSEIHTRRPGPDNRAGRFGADNRGHLLQGAREIPECRQSGH